MKIIEIINEDINESIWSRLFGAPVRGAARLLGAARLPRRERITNYALRYRPGVNTHGRIDGIRDRDLLNDFPGEDLARVRREIARRSEPARAERELRQNWRGLTHRWRQIRSVARALPSTWTTVIGVELATILWGPFSHYIERMDLADQWLNAKEESERWTEDQYNKFHHAEIMNLIEKLAKLLIVNKVLKLPGHALKVLFGTRFGDAFNRLTTPVRLWIAGNLALSKEFSEFLPVLLVEQALSREYVTDAVGSTLISQAEDYVFNRINTAEQDSTSNATEQPTAQTTPTTGQSTTSQPTAQTTPTTGQSTTSQPTAQTTPTTGQSTTSQPTRQATQKSTIELLKPYKPEDWEYVSQQSVKHIPTNTYHPKAVVDRFK